MADPVFNPPGCQVPAVEPIEPLPDVICELPDPDLTPIRDCLDPLFPASARGAAGPQGWPGPPGIPGLQGEQGPKGAKGQVGPAGYRGPPGRRGPQGPDGRLGPQGPQGYDGPQGPQGPRGYDWIDWMGFQGNEGKPICENPFLRCGPPGAKGDKGPPAKEAIVAIATQAGPQIVGLFCLESPEVRFNDIIRVRMSGQLFHVQLDPRYLSCCAPESIYVSSLVASEPVEVGAQLIGDQIVLRAASEVHNLRVTLRLSGIRRRRQGVRFPQFTQRQMQNNNRFWGRALEE